MSGSTGGRSEGKALSATCHPNLSQPSMLLQAEASAGLVTEGLTLSVQESLDELTSPLLCHRVLRLLGVPKGYLFSESTKQCL